MSNDQSSNLGVDDKKVRQIHQLLKHAEGTSYEEERDAYVTRAQKLASRYSIDMELLRARAEGLDDEERERANRPTKRSYEMGTKGDRGAGTFADLFVHMARANDIKCYWNNAGVDAFGMSVDLDYVESLFSLLLPQMISECEDYLETEEWRSDRGATKLSARKAFCFGFGERVYMRLMEAKQEAMREASAADSSTTLVVRDKRKRVQDFYDMNVKSRRYRTPSRGGSASARSAGRVSGSNASFTGSKGRVGR